MVKRTKASNAADGPGGINQAAADDTVRAAVGARYDLSTTPCLYDEL